MPIRERRSALYRVMSRPPNWIAPALAGRSPEITLISVVLPAPFGPSTACRRPRCSSRSTSLTAFNPPKRRDNPRVDNTASLIARCPDERALEPRRDAGEASRQEDHQQDDRAPEQQRPVRGDRREHFG